jgi:DNA processing protein
MQAELAGPVPPEGWAVALALLPGMGPVRLRALTRRWTAEEAWRRVVAGRVVADREVAVALGRRAGALAEAWRRAGADIEPGVLWSRYRAEGVGVSVLGSSAFPAPLAADVEPPTVIFHRGDPDVVAGPRVAVVGTRRCTRYGLDVARELSRDLAASGVSIVSGLALGIDGAAHVGALDAGTAPPIAVVGSGLDVIYPRVHAALWRRIEAAGVVLSEAPLGARPEAWRFPARNRIIAALADAVVVVETPEAGGSMHTVTEAARRDRPVLAVPGPIRSRASAGTNRLLADGATPVCDANDVLMTLGLGPALRRDVRDRRPPPAEDDTVVLDALGWQPATLEQVAISTGADLGELTLSLRRLTEQGWISERAGWYERVARAE